jgi:hypothetical protein
MGAMTIAWQDQLRPGVALREVVEQATAALIGMDAERLEELARCCADLNQAIVESGETVEAASDLQTSRNDVEILGRILHETRANYIVLSRLFVLRLQDASTSDGKGSLRQADSIGRTLEKWDMSVRKAEYGDN